MSGMTFAKKLGTMFGVTEEPRRRCVVPGGFFFFWLKDGGGDCKIELHTGLYLQLDQWNAVAPHDETSALFYNDNSGSGALVIVVVVIVVVVVVVVIVIVSKVKVIVPVVIIEFLLVVRDIVAQ